MSEWIDISVPLGPGTVCWPGDRPFGSVRECAIDAGDACTVTSFGMSAHLGTHMDAPLHYFAQGTSIDSLALEAGIGPARVLAVEASVIEPRHIEALDINRGERILFRTANSARTWHDQPFSREYVHLTSGAARHLAQRRPALVGIDYLSVGDPGDDGAETHRILLGAGIWIVEALYLREVEPGDYHLICLPLKIAGSEGAPARAVLKRLVSNSPC